MFNLKKKLYTRKSLTKTTNDYNEVIETYSLVSNILMFVSFVTKQEASNDMRITQCSHIGLTSDAVSVGDLINDKWIIEFINKEGREKKCYMKEVDSNGYFSR